MSFVTRSSVTDAVRAFDQLTADRLRVNDEFHLALELFILHESFSARTLRHITNSRARREQRRGATPFATKHYHPSEPCVSESVPKF